MQYDLANIRCCAREIAFVVRDLRRDAQRSIGEVEDALYPGFRGEAAGAFRNALGNLEDELAAVIKSLDGVGNELEAFARRLEEADQLARMRIKAKRDN